MLTVRDTRRKQGMKIFRMEGEPRHVIKRNGEELSLPKDIMAEDVVGLYGIVEVVKMVAVRFELFDALHPERVHDINATTRFN